MTPRRCWVRLRAVLVVAAAALTAAVGCSSSHRSDGPSLREVNDLLARHGAAVLSRSQSAFLDDVDTGAAAAGFRGRQQAQFAALAEVPMQSWRYTVLVTVTDRDATTAASQRYGASTLIVHVTVSYALRWVDATPSTHDLWWTFVRRHGRVVLAGDDDMAQLGGASWRGPWDFGPLVVQRGRHSLVLGHPASASALPALVTAVDAAVPAVTGVWGAGWSQQVAVVVASSQEELTVLGGQSARLADISAAAISDPPNPLSDAVSGQRILMNPAVLDSLTPIGQRIVLRHEVVHVAAAAATGEAVPRWLVEGFAEYVANLGSGQPVVAAAAELRAAVRAGRLPRGLPSDAEFAAPTGLAQRYEESWLACRLIAARTGAQGLVRFYRLVGASDQPAQQAVAAAMQSVVHESLATFTARWLAYLRTELA